MNQLIQRVAHRGGAGLAPENTLAAFRNALLLPIDAIELDVHLSRDGNVVVFHDNLVNKRTNGTGNLLDLDFSYLRSLNAAAHFPGGWPDPQQIPTLGEVLELAKGHVKVYIEIKSSKRKRTYGRYSNIAEKVVEVVRSTTMIEQVIVISFDWKILPIIKSLEPGIQTGMIVSNDVWNSRASNALTYLMEESRALECNWINMHNRLVSNDMPQIIHENGSKLGLWTVNSLAALQRFAAIGVDSLTTNRPDLFSALKL